MLMHFQ
ncbi:hypothetical protein CFP56_037853 [Quercus suber]